MPAATEDYVLGIHDAEIARLGLQHRVWRESMLGAWRRAGLGAGWRVVDLGAGPVYATFDLADLVGPAGQVLAVGGRVHSLPTSRRALVRAVLTQAEGLPLVGGGRQREVRSRSPGPRAVRRASGPEPQEEGSGKADVR